MTAEERRALLGDEAIAELRERVALAPEPSDELVEKLRRIICPATRVPQPRPAAPAPTEPAHITAVPA